MGEFVSCCSERDEPPVISVADFGRSTVGYKTFTPRRSIAVVPKMKKKARSNFQLNHQATGCGITPTMTEGLSALDECRNHLNKIDFRAHRERLSDHSSRSASPRHSVRSYSSYQKRRRNRLAPYSSHA